MTQKLPLVLVDFENFHIPLNEQYKLVITEEGLNYLLSQINPDTQIHNNVHVAAYWQTINKYKMYFNNKFATVIDVVENKKDSADGYLLVDGMKFLYENFGEFDELVLIGGDSIYLPLIRHFISKGKKVNVYAWEQSLSKSFTMPNVAIKSFESVFCFNEINVLDSLWFSSYEISDIEKNIIERFKTSRYPSLVFNYLANQIADSSKDVYMSVENYKQAEKLLNNFVDSGLLILDRSCVKGRNTKVLTLNYNNDKVRSFT